MEALACLGPRGSGCGGPRAVLQLCRRRGRPSYPRVWDTVTPEAANAARERGSVAALRRILGDLADTPGVACAADLVVKAGTSARTEGRALYAAVRTLPLPTEPVARFWHGGQPAARSTRGDGHVAALLTVGIGGAEAHMLHALSAGVPAENFGRASHLPRAGIAEPYVLAGSKPGFGTRRLRSCHDARVPEVPVRDSQHSGHPTSAHRRTAELAPALAPRHERPRRPP